jgi:Domain of unknown function (DUF4376)
MIFYKETLDGNTEYFAFDENDENDIQQFIRPNWIKITELPDRTPILSLAERRAKCISAIKSERDRRKFNGVFVSNKWIHTDTYSRTQWLGMVLMGTNLPSIPWTTMDGSTINTTPALAAGVFQSASTLDASLFGYATSLISSVNSSSNPEAVDITTGWPRTYGE